MTRYKNFTKDGATPRIADTEYESCNFSQPAPDTSGGGPRGVRLFPGDDTPRTFRSCNLLNCEVPPGSTVIDCLTAVKRFAASVVDVPNPRKTPRWENGLQVSQGLWGDRTTKHEVYGRYVNGVFEEWPSPQVIEEKSRVNLEA